MESGESQNDLLEKLSEEDHLIWLHKYAEEKGLPEFWKLFWGISSSISSKFYKKKVVQFELKCPAIMSLTTRKNLNHRERTALMMLYLKLGDDGEKRLYEILTQQDNYKESLCKYNIEYYKKHGKNLGISCEKLKEWGICDSEFSDCHKREKDDKPV